MKIKSINKCNICNKKIKKLSIVVQVSELKKKINCYYGYCKYCDYAQAINIPENSFLKKYYENNSQLRRKLLIKEDKLHIAKQIRFSFKYLSVSGKKHLEIGPDMGHFLQSLKLKLKDGKFFFKEFNPFARKYLKKLGFIEHKEQKMDSISILHVFEHIPNPIKFLKYLKKIISTNGVIFIEVPDYSVLDTRKCDTFQFEHISYFSTNSILKIAKKTGMSVESIERDQTDNYTTTQSQVLRFILRKISKINQKSSWELLSDANNNKLNYIQNIIKKYKALGHKVAIYGAGSVTQQINATFTLDGYIEKVYDNDPKKTNKILFGTNVINSNNIKTADFTKIILFEMGYKKEVIEFLKSKGITKKKIISIS